ncbi:MAG: hypothetical protein JNK48_03150 [Bryobacterales bacterium]|nr:hypothetical protein [Bryobacterales bacterium]
MMKLFLLALVGGSLFAQQTFAGYEVRISQETAPPGGVAQVKLTLTDPEPIITGSSRFEFDSFLVDSVLGISVHSPAGDAIGTATYENGRLSFRLSSPLASMGAGYEYPFLTVAVAIRPGAPVGASTTIALDLANTTFINAFGQPAPVACKPGKITVGGTASIDNIVPGGGWIAPGQRVAVLGRGFTPDSRLRVEGQDVNQFFLSSDRMEFAPIRNGFRLDGSEIRVRIQKNTQLTYYSYLRPQVVPSQSVYGNVVPLFAPHAPRLAMLLYSLRGEARAVALQNPHTTAVEVTVTAPLSFASSPHKVTVPPLSRLTLDLANIFPRATQSQLANVFVSAPAGIALLGLERDSPTSPAAARPALILQAGPF